MNIRVYGLMRSGHHAILDWIYKNLPEDKMFINNCQSGGNFHWYKINGGEQIYEGKNIDKYKDYHIIYNFEHQKIETSWTNNWKSITEDFSILILRDPYNWLASSMNKKYFNVDIKLDINLWINHAKHYLSNKELIVINYNKWVLDLVYRDEILSKLGISNQFKDITTFKGQSSFGESKDYFNRWETYKDNKLYLDKINNKELYNLSREIFNFNPINLL